MLELLKLRVNPFCYCFPCSLLRICLSAALFIVSSYFWLCQLHEISHTCRVHYGKQFGVFVSSIFGQAYCPCPIEQSFLPLAFCLINIALLLEIPPALLQSFSVSYPEQFNCSSVCPHGFSRSWRRPFWMPTNRVYVQDLVLSFWFCFLSLKAILLLLFVFIGY